MAHMAIRRSMSLHNANNLSNHAICHIADMCWDIGQMKVMSYGSRYERKVTSEWIERMVNTRIHEFSCGDWWVVVTGLPCHHAIYCQYPTHPQISHVVGNLNFYIFQCWEAHENIHVCCASDWEQNNLDNSFQHDYVWSFEVFERIRKS